MKKKYNTPGMCIVEIQNISPLANSDISSDVGLGYGGVDDDGSIIPEARENIWDDGWE